MIKLAWRNIWRNRRRAIITMASVFFAVFFCTLMYGFQTGVWDKMIDNTLRTQTGHIHIHGNGYWDDKTVDNFLTANDETIARIEHIENVENVSPRVETFAMASFGTVSKGVAVTGISPAKETEKSNLPVRIVEGAYLTETDDGILIGQGLRNYLKVNIGDTLAFIGQGYHGASAAGLFPVRGILKMPISEMDNGLVYMTLQSAQTFIDMPDGYSGIFVSLKNDMKRDKTIAELNAAVNSGNYEILSWRYTMKDLLRTAESDKAFSKIILFILYLIVGFGILGTVIMMTNERRREFSVMISLGMQRRQLKWLFAVELTMMALSGAVASLFATVPITLWFHAHPIELSGEMAKMYIDMGMEAIMPMSADFSIFATQILIVFLMTCLTLLYP
ncbi:MAG: ABC transporter permease, partial [Prevotellaceae bacterium]|nr:ABC transporter permease [Prevotellaceae bacterium]